ncbi:MAG: hypothetical protein IPG07_03300 [Crocinitomicaceae bacterium]|nr:hypothetical protein [Crocinitomicaceae bacterium]
MLEYDPDGNLIWVNKFQGDQCRSYSIDVDANGNSYITGMISGLTQFDSNITGEANAIVYGFIAKYNSNGICVWASYVDSPYGSMGNDLKIINDETIVITGYYKGSIFTMAILFGGSTSWGNFICFRLTRRVVLIGIKPEQARIQLQAMTLQ